MKFILTYFIVTMLLLSSCQNNDALYLKELKQQNKFLEEQYQQAKEAIKYKVQSHPAAKPYNDVFVKQSAFLENFIDSLKEYSKLDLDKQYKTFIEKHNDFCNKTQKAMETKLLNDDAKLLLITNDSLPSYSDNELIIETIKERLLSKSITMAQLYKDATYSYYNGMLNFDRLTNSIVIQKDSLYKIILKFNIAKRSPYFKKLEFISLCKIKKAEFQNEDKYTNIYKEVITINENSDGIIFKTKPLEKGF